MGVSTACKNWAQPLKRTLVILAVWYGMWAAPELAAAENWTQVAQSDRATVYIDTKSIGQKDGYKRAWEKWDYAEDRSPLYPTTRKPYRSARFLTYFNCKEKSTAELQAIYYDASGEVVGKGTTDPKDTAFTYVVPGLLSESTLEFVCKAKSRTKP
jgi:hypothetical protein